MRAAAPPGACRRPVNRLSALAHLLPFCRPYAGRFALAFVFLCVAAGATLAIPFAFRQLIDHGFATVAAGNRADIDAYFLALFGIAAVLAVFTAARFYMVSWLGERVTADLRTAVYGRMLQQDPRFFETTQVGEVLSRLTADTTLVQTVIGTSVSMGLRNLFLFAGGLAMLIVTSPRATLVIVGVIVVTVVPVALFGRRVRRLSRASQDRVADASALAGEVLGAIPVVQAFTNEALERRRFGAAVERAFAAAVTRTRARAWLTVVVILIVFGGAVYGLWLGAIAVAAGSMSAGALAQAILYVAIVAGSVGALAEVMGELMRAAGATERLIELHTAVPAITAPAVPTPLPPRAAGTGVRVEFDAVVFHYPTRPAQAALEHVSLAVRPGETIAVVGPSGAGKSTLMQLLLRFHDPDAGAVRLDGIDLRALALADLRARVAFVPQEVVIFGADAMENIRYGNPGADDAAVIAAARAAHAHEFIERLPDGYRTFLGERGLRLSGGQRQRIAIARAILKDAPLLLLDEATSALDAESEQLVRQAIESAARGRTTLIIAHRLSTVRSADRVVVLDGGRVVETGEPARLLADGGLYARLAQLQVSETLAGAASR
ncbi:MAG: ATP-binding cassette domain-containing protein [Burkholderiales bacterium]|nr:ATP-binding cassette domain-containing protein [Burkholderiales bacterium]